MYLKFVVILLIFVSAYAETKHLRKANLKGVIDINLADVVLTKVRENVWTIYGFVTYPNWDNCWNDIRENDLELVCVVSDNDITVGDLLAMYNEGISINCNGNVVDNKFKFNAVDPKYYACGVTDGYIVHYKAGNILPFPAYAIALIVVGAVLVFCVCGCVAYCKHKQ